MFTPGGQHDLLSFAGMRGGGKGGGGGGSSYTPPPPVFTDPVSGKSFQSQLDITGHNTGLDALNAEIAQREADAQTKSDAATTTANQTAATNEQTFQTNRQAAYDTALQQAIGAFQKQGVDPNTYMQSDIVPTLQRQFQSVQDLDPNPTAAFPTNLGDTIVNNVLSGKRTQSLNALNNIFTPNYAQNALPDTTTGNYVSDVVNQQFDPLMAQLTNAQKRGTLTAPGYQAALDKFNTAKTGATNTVQNLGAGILSSDRSALNDYISGARSDVNSLTLGQAFDPKSYSDVASGKVTSDLSNFGGALQNAVGDTKFANISDLINAGGAVQGSQNPNAANPTGPKVPSAGGDAPPPPDTTNLQRGLGNVGAF